MSVERLVKATEYRRQAHEIRTIVERIAIDEAREHLLETAEHLEALAKEEECKAQADGAEQQTRSEA
jgi:GTP cyclohydrolase I